MIYKLKTDKGCSIEITDGVATITGLGYKWLQYRQLGERLHQNMIIIENFEPDYFNTYYKQL